jgi:hypothetical protein
MQNGIIQIQYHDQLASFPQLVQQPALKILRHLLTELDLITLFDIALARDLFELLLVGFLAAGGAETVEHHWVLALGQQEEQFRSRQQAENGRKARDLARERAQQTMF